MSPPGLNAKSSTEAPALKNSRVAVIGGGIAGLTAAYSLKKAGAKLLVYEGGAIGGLVQTQKVGGFILELGPNVFLEKPSLSALIDELGLTSDKRYPAVERYEQLTWHDGKVVKVPRSPGELLRSPLLLRRNKYSLIPSLFRSSKVAKNSPDLSVLELFAPLLGEKAVYSIVDPILKGIYGGDVASLSSKALFPLLWGHLASGGSFGSYLLKKLRGGTRQKVVTLLNGSHSLVERLADRLSVGEFRWSSVKTVEYDSARTEFVITPEKGRAEQVDRVYVATSGAQSSQFLGNLAPALSQVLDGITYAPLVVLHCAVDQDAPVPSKAFGILFPKGSFDPVLGVMCNSIVFPHMAPSSRHLLTVCIGGAGAQTVLDSTDEALFELTEKVLESVFGLRDVELLNVTRWPRAIPQYKCGYSAVLDEFRRTEAQFPGLHFLGVDTGGVGVADRVAKGMDVGGGV